MPNLGPLPPLVSGTTIALGEGSVVLEGSASTLRPSREPSFGLDPIPGLPPRYEDRGLLGVGGMGEVRRAWDRQLERHVAMKVLKQELARESMRLRFLAEAKLTADLEHPGIVALHDQGELADGRVWFTMREVHGRTFHELIQGVHLASVGSGEWKPAVGDWTFRRLITVFESVCETVAYVHFRSVVHRDLKPRNIMVGEFGEVQVMDWGLARRTGVVQAQEGVAGTPGYMSPEQIRRSAQQYSPATDVFSLGAILYEILVGLPPFPAGEDGLAVTLSGVLAPPASRVIEGHPPLPEALVTLCMHALRPDPAERPADASALARQVRAWSEGVRRRAEAVEAVQRADERLPIVAGLRDEASALLEDGRQRQGGVAAGAAEEDRWPGWELEDRARVLSREADLEDLAHVQALRGALEVDPTAPEPHERLADFYRAQVVAAERAGDVAGAERGNALLRRHDRGRHAAFLLGNGAISLVTDPPGAEVLLHRFEERHRSLEAVFQRSLGVTPLCAVEIPRGSYLLSLRLEGHEVVSYPIMIGREEHWDGVAPGESVAAAVRLPRLGELGANDCYVPAGWFASGGDPEASDATEARKLWVDGFVIRRFPVTCEEYREYLDQVLAERGGGAAAELLPGSNGATFDSQPIRNVGAAHELAVDSAGRRWLPEWPVTCLDWSQARAYAVHTARALPWRLPGDLEREKAGRGVDGRCFPWGNWGESGRSCTQRSHSGTPSWAPVDLFPRDVSLYGVRGLAGNVRDWCGTSYSRDGERGPRAVEAEASLAAEWINVRGGAWTGGLPLARLAGRLVARRPDRLTNVGLRLVRSFGS